MEFETYFKRFSVAANQILTGKKHPSLNGSRRLIFMEMRAEQATQARDPSLKFVRTKSIRDDQLQPDWSFKRVTGYYVPDLFVALTRGIERLDSDSERDADGDTETHPFTASEVALYLDTKYLEKLSSCIDDPEWFLRLKIVKTLQTKYSLERGIDQSNPLLAIEFQEKIEELENQLLLDRKELIELIGTFEAGVESLQAPTERRTSANESNTKRQTELKRAVIAAINELMLENKNKGVDNWPSAKDVVRYFSKGGDTTSTISRVTEKGIHWLTANGAESIIKLESFGTLLSRLKKEGLNSR